MHAPPFPGNGMADLGMTMTPGPLATSALAAGSAGLQVGAAVLLNGQGPTVALVGSKGVVTAIRDGLHEVRLDSGLVVGSLMSEALTLVPMSDCQVPKQSLQRQEIKAVVLATSTPLLRLEQRRK